MIESNRTHSKNFLKQKNGSKLLNSTSVIELIGRKFVNNSKIRANTQFKKFEAFECYNHPIDEK